MDEMLMLVLFWAFIIALVYKLTEPAKQTTKTHEFNTDYSSIKQGIETSETNAELDFWLNEIALFRREFDKTPGVLSSTQRLYAIWYNKQAELKLTAFSL